MEFIPDKWYPKRVLLKTMKDHGCSWSTSESLFRVENEGRLTLPRSASRRKDRVVQGWMIPLVVESFSPGGRGEWHYDEVERPDAQ